MIERIKAGLNKFFFPPAGSTKFMYVLPYITLAVLGIMVMVGGVYTWDYTNSPKFCGTSCHTMPPQDVTYKQSPHANVACEECHIGRAFVGDQLIRKSEGLRELYAQTFKTYELPIVASRLRPARDTCETCHLPEAFKDDKLKVITHFKGDEANTPYNIYLVLKTGGGAKRDGQGKGIHWHIVNKVEYYETDNRGQNIPYVRIQNDDGTTTEYIDVETDFDPKSIDESQLRVMDCTSCHNRVSHNFKSPNTSMDEYLSKKLIDVTIPNIHTKGIEILSVSYETQEEGLAAIAGLEEYYKTSYADFYAQNPDSIKNAVTQIQKIYTESVFIEQKVNWESHPNNVGHVETAGCFRCHDGKHLDEKDQAIRLECNLCHSVPVVADEQDFVTKIEISRGPEPESHRNPNWISMHNKIFDQSCTACHDTSDAGSTTNTSFCSNSACHGTTFKFAGFDAPKLREIIQAQLRPTPSDPAPAGVPEGGVPDYAAHIQPLFDAKCTACHNSNTVTGGLDLSNYEALMLGGKDGAVILPGDTANSLLLSVQNGQHFGNLSAEELDLVSKWIEAGALAPTAPPAGDPTYATSISALLKDKCAMCHQGESAPKGLNLSSYETMMKGGTDGPVIIIGDSSGSKLIVVQSETHAINFSADEMALFKKWIDAGAPEK